MNPTDPDPSPPEESPLDPAPLPPDGAVPPLQPKPWQKSQQEQQHDNGSGVADGSGTGDVIDAGVQGASLGADIIGGAIEVAGNVAGGAIEVAGSVAGGALEGAGTALEAAGGCADGCSGCSLAFLMMLTAAASTAMAVFR
jgi:hypothetical protein